MLNKKIVESIFAELNESANEEWRDDRYLSLVRYEELEDDAVHVVFGMGKDDVTYYSCVFAPDGYEYEKTGSGSNEEDAEEIMELLMDQYDSAHYFVLDQVDEDKWKLTDEANGVSVTWEISKFNETQVFDPSGFDLQKYGKESANILATITRRMTDWLVDNHPELVMGLNARQLLGRQLAELRRSQNITVRELADMSGLTKTTISNIEMGRFSPKVETLEQYLAPLGARIQIVLKED